MPKPYGDPLFDVRENPFFIDIGDRASTYNFDHLPESIAVIGGGDRPDDIKAIMNSTGGKQKIELGEWSDIMNADSTDILSVSADKVSFTITNDRGVVDVFNFTGDAALQILGTMSSRVDLKDKWSSDGGTSADGVESGFSRGIAVFDFGEDNVKPNGRGGDKFFHGSDGDFSSEVKKLFTGSSLSEGEVDEFVFELLDDYTDVDQIGYDGEIVVREVTETSVTFAADNGRATDVIVLMGEVVEDAIADYGLFA